MPLKLEEEIALRIESLKQCLSDMKMAYPSGPASPPAHPFWQQHKANKKYLFQPLFDAVDELSSSQTSVKLQKAYSALGAVINELKGRKVNPPKQYIDRVNLAIERLEQEYNKLVPNASMAFKQ